MRRILGIVAVCAVGTSAWGQDLVTGFGGFTRSGVVTDGTVVFDNRTTVLGFLASGNDRERGDGATLAGTDRIVTNILLPIHGNGGAHIADVRVRIYDGGDTAPGTNPGALLWESALFPAMAIANGTNDYNFAVPNVLVGNELTWTLELTNVIGPGVAGTRYFDPPTVGSSMASFQWEHTGGVWVANQFAQPNQLGAIITAIPTPGSLSLLAIGAVVMLRRRR